MIDLAEYLDIQGIVLREENGENGAHLVCECPFCDRPKLYVNVEEGHDHEGLWVCYRCDERGNAAKLIEELDGVTRFEAKIIATGLRDAHPLATVEDWLRSREAASEAPEEEDRVVVLPPAYEPVWSGPRPRMPSYLTERGISPKIAGAYRLGVCAWGRYGGRVVIPAYDEEDNLLTFQARSVDGREPKYLNPGGERGKFLLGVHRLKGATRVALVEGPFDVLGCAKAGVPSVAVLGKVVTDAHIRTLTRLGVTDVVMMFDPEAATDAERQARSRFYDDFRPVLSTLASGDPGDQPSDAVREAFEKTRRATRFGRFAAG